MIVSYDQIKNLIDSFIKEYEEMHINGVIVNCPYWMNKIKDGKVVLRGFKDGKGKACEIRALLNVVLDTLEIKNRHSVTPLFLRKLAKRERIGIDCSGLAYRVLENLVGLHYIGCKVNSLDEVFSGGINRTNVMKLTSLQFAIPMKNVTDLRLGDMIRMMSGKHVLIILEATDSEICYVHSSHMTKIQGVHREKIKIVDIKKPLDSQRWLEKTKDGYNFGLNHFHIDKGDGIYRLKVFC